MQLAHDTCRSGVLRQRSGVTGTAVPACSSNRLGSSSSSSRLRSSRRGPPPAAVWTRPTPDKDENWTRPSYVPTPGQSPVITPYRREDQPLYAPSGPEFKPAELPEQTKEMPKGPTMPERRPDPIPAGTPKEKPPAGEPQPEAPPAPAKDK